MHHKTLSVLLFCMISVSLSTARAEIIGNYLGFDACEKCHEDKAAGWKNTRHAHAFENLRTQGEEKQNIPECFRCHVTGFGNDGGYIDPELTPELKDVQCEACHGAGRAHAEAGGDPAKIAARPDETTCRVCHTPGQDKNFDYILKSKAVH